MISSERAPKKNARLHPVSLYGADGETECFSSLGLVQSAEEAAVHDSGESLIPRGESLERVVELEDHHGLIVGGDRLVIEGDEMIAAAALHRVVRSGAVHEDVPHGERRDGKKVPPVAPHPGRLFDEPEVGLMNQCRRRQRSAATAPEPVMRDGAEVTVRPSDDLLERLERALRQIRRC